MRQFTEKDLLALQAIHTEAEDMLSPYASRNADAVREHASKYDDDALRTQYAIDTDKIIHSFLYNRGSDKTQVFSFYRNDDITRRASHMQLVSRIARTIGKALGLNLDLIEAISIGHDVGHTPFGHKGEEFLNELYHGHTGRYFHHNVHSVRVLQQISGCNLTLQTLDGILCHCGEKDFEHYEPAALSGFEAYHLMVERCYTEKDLVDTLRPGTLEGCVVRLSDMIAYLGKDRQDAAKAKIKNEYAPNLLGQNNTDIINAIITDVIGSSFGLSHLAMSPDVKEAMSALRKENNALIYQLDEVTMPYYQVIQPMMELLYERFLAELTANDYSSLIFQHLLNERVIGSFYRDHQRRFVDLDKHDPNDIVVDFIASMTDDYFIDAFRHLFPHSKLNDEVQYVEYFDARYRKGS